MLEKISQFYLNTNKSLHITICKRNASQSAVVSGCAFYLPRKFNFFAEIKFVFKVRKN